MAYRRALEMQKPRSVEVVPTNEHMGVEMPTTDMKESMHN
jgi:hypothetical protein